MQKFLFSALLIALPVGVKAQNLEYSSNAHCATIIASATSTPSQCANTYPTGSESAAGYALATYGSAHASAAANGSSYVVSNENYLLTASGGGIAKFTDALTITSPGHSGAANLTFTVYLDASLTGLASAPGSFGDAVEDSSVLTYLTVNQSTFDSEISQGATSSDGLAGTSSAQQDLNGVNGVSPLGYVNYTVPFTFGQSFSLSMELDVGASINPVAGDATAAATATAINSFDWAGINSVTQSGQSLAYSVTSASGTNYAQSFAPIIAAVPEPGTYALMGAGLVTLAAVSRKRQRSEYRYR